MSLFSTSFTDISFKSSSGQSEIEELYRKLTVAAAVFFIVLEIAYLTMGGLPPIAKPWIDGTDFVFGRDFLNTWMGGRSAFFGGPAPWFDLVAYNQTIQQMLGSYYQDHYWSYPPHIMLFIWPFGLMPYLPAYIAWCVIGIALYLLACSLRIPRKQLLFLAVAPGITVCVFFGQNGFYTSALLVGGLLCLDRRPILAGVLFGILTIKPQLGMLLPILLILEERWLTILSAAVTAAVLITLTSLLFGWDIWIEFWHKVLPQQQTLMEEGGGVLFAVVSSVFFAGRELELPLDFDWAAQWTVSALAFVSVVWTFWKRRDRDLSLALFVTATFLFTPYVLNYDMVIFGFVVALLRDRSDNTMGDHYLMIAVWSVPVTMMLAAVIWLPLAPIVLIAFECRLLWRLAHTGTRTENTLPGGLSPAAA